MATQLWNGNENLSGSASGADAVTYKNGTVEGALDELNDSLSKQNNYSTEEQVIGTWIDGKPLYRKMVKYTNAGDYGFDFSNIDHIHIGGNTYLIDANKNQSLPVFYTTSDYNFTAYLDMGNKQVIVLVGKLYTVKEVGVELLYTKTTD